MYTRVSSSSGIIPILTFDRVGVDRVGEENVVYIAVSSDITVYGLDSTFFFVRNLPSSFQSLSWHWQRGPGGKCRARIAQYTRVYR